MSPTFRPDTTDAEIWHEVWEGEHPLPDRFAPGDVVLDVGAHIGAFAALAASKGAMVWSYEPWPDNFRLLVENTRGLSVHPVPCGIGKNYGLATFTEGPEPGNFAACTSVCQSPRQDRVSNAGVTIPISRALEIAGLPLRYCKIDCEGGEYEIIPAGQWDQVAEIDVEFHSIHHFVGELDLCRLHLARTHRETYAQVKPHDTNLMLGHYLRR